MNSPAPRTSLRKSLIVIFVVRSVLNTAHRIIYPFLPSIARGLGISLQAASALVTVRLVAGLTAPFMGTVADRRGRRPTMEIALVAFGLANALLAITGSLAAAIVAFALFGLSKVLYDPAVHAYVGDTVPYQERGRAIGIVELSWSSAWLIGVPAAGLLIEQWGWRAPWFALAGLGVLGIWLTHSQLPPSRATRTGAEDKGTIAGMLATWRSLLRRRSVVLLLCTSTLLSLANELPFIVYGAWLEATFGLSLSALGLASIVVGVAETSAELGTVALTDRWGKRRSVTIGMLALAATSLLLPWFSELGLAAALAGVALMVLTFEFAIVSIIPLATEIVPEARAALLGLNITAFSLGRIIGAVAGGWLWTWQEPHITMHAVAGACCALIGALLIGLGMREPGQ